MYRGTEHNLCIYPQQYAQWCVDKKGWLDEQHGFYFYNMRAYRQEIKQIKPNQRGTHYNITKLWLWPFYVLEQKLAYIHAKSINATPENSPRCKNRIYGTNLWWKVSHRPCSILDREKEGKYYHDCCDPNPRSWSTEVQAMWSKYVLAYFIKT